MTHPQVRGRQKGKLINGSASQVLEKQPYLARQPQFFPRLQNRCPDIKIDTFLIEVRYIDKGILLLMNISSSLFSCHTGRVACLCPFEFREGRWFISVNKIWTEVILSKRLIFFFFLNWLQAFQHSLPLAWRSWKHVFHGGSILSHYMMVEDPTGFPLDFEEKK